MTDAVSPSSSAVNATIDRDNRPQTKDDVMDKIRETSFEELIEQHNQIKEGLFNQLKTLAESRQDGQPQYTVPDIKTSAAYREILKKYNLSEQEGIDLLEKAKEKIQELKA